MRPALIFLFLIVPAMVVLAAIAQPFVDPRLLMLDSMVAAEESGQCCKTYYGLISNLGIMGWAASAAACLLSAMILHSFGANRMLVLFAVFAAGFSAMLGFDDAFLFHENLAQKIGLQQELVLGFYVLTGLAYLAMIWTVRDRADLPMLAATGAFLAMSLGLDVVLHSTDPMVVSLEDGAKFIGICGWLGFHLDMMTRLVCQVGKHQWMRPDRRRRFFNPQDEIAGAVQS